MAPLHAPSIGACLAVAAIVLMSAAPATGHGSETTGSILVPFTDASSTITGFTVLGLARAVSSTSLPNGIVTWTLPVTTGDTFKLDGAGASDFDVGFTNGGYVNGPGDEAGTVPGTGHAVIYLFFGVPGSGFTWHEGF